MLKAVFASYFERAAHYSSILFNSVVLDCCLFTEYSEMLESDEIYKISFWLCHVFREERHQCIKQLQQGNKKKINAWLKPATTFLVQLIVEEMYSVRAKMTAQKAEKPPPFLLFTRHLTLTFYLPCHRLSLEHLL